MTEAKWSHPACGFEGTEAEVAHHMEHRRTLCPFTVRMLAREATVVEFDGKRIIAGSPEQVERWYRNRGLEPPE